MMSELRRCAWPLLLTQLSGLVLFLSWLLPPTAGQWQSLDEATYRWLNGSLQQNSLATLFWAWLNTRAADLVAAVLLYTLGIVAAGRMAHAQRTRFFHRALAMMVVMVMVSTVEYLIEFGLFAYHRASPTMVLDHGVRLSQVVPAAKDISNQSFPGDHGYVLICVTMLFALTAPRRFAWAAMGIAVFFSLPRVIGGAHWLTDIVVGSSAKVLLTTGWLFATPLWDRLADRIERGLSKLPFNPVDWGCRRWWGDPPPARDTEPSTARAYAESPTMHRAA